MSANYYYITSKDCFCKSCGVYHHSDNPNIFIGRCDNNRAFKLMIYTDIPNLETWQARWELPGTLIVTSGGIQISPVDMLTIITFRESDNIRLSRRLYGDEKFGSHGLIHIRPGYTIDSTHGQIICIGQEDSYDLFRKTN